MFPLEDPSMKRHPSTEDVSAVEKIAYVVLDEIGLPYKRVSRYEFVDEEGTAIWIGGSETHGRIGSFLGRDAEAVAHEIGHGFLDRGDPGPREKGSGSDGSERQAVKVGVEPPPQIARREW
jgi:nucleoid-associated protein YgaU